MSKKVNIISHTKHGSTVMKDSAWDFYRSMKGLKND